MHLRNSCTRSTSRCAIRHVPSGASGGRGVNFVIPFFTRKFHETSVTRSLIGGNVRIGSTVTGSCRLSCVQPRHAHQPRLAVDLRRARPALARLAVPAARPGRAPARPGSCARRRAPPCPPRRSVLEGLERAVAVRACVRQILNVACAHYDFCSSMTCFSSGGIGGSGYARHLHAPSADLLHHDVERARTRRRLSGIVLAEVTAAAFLALDAPTA